MKMAFIERKPKDGEVSDLRSPYFDYKLKISQRSLFLMLIVTCLFNILLLVPDLNLI